MTRLRTILLAAIVLGILLPAVSHAESCDSVTLDEGIVLNIRLPGLPTCTRTVGAQEQTFSVATGLGQYLVTFYVWFAGVAGTLAVFMVMFGGFQWLTAAGNAGRIGQAKETITGAIIGLILLLGSYVLLNTISPQFVSLKFNVASLKSVPIGSYSCLTDTPNACTQGKCSPLVDTQCASSSSGSCGCFVSCTADEQLVDYTRCGGLAADAVARKTDPNATSSSLQISPSDYPAENPPYYLSALMAAYRSDNGSDADSDAALTSWLTTKKSSTPGTCLLYSTSYPGGCITAQSVYDTFVLSRAHSIAKAGQTDFLLFKRDDTLVVQDYHACCQLRSDQTKCTIRTPTGPYPSTPGTCS